MLKKLHLYASHFRRIGFTQGLQQVGFELQRKMMRPSYLRGFPDTLHIEISNTCNLSCEYCMLRNSLPGEKLMSLDTFELLKPYVKYVRSISLSGLAEPLLNRNLVSILHEIKEISSQCQVVILSNATLLNGKLCEQLVDEKLDFFGFSLDGANSVVTDGIRKGGTLESVIDNIRLLNSIRTRKKSSMPAIVATTVLQRKNYRQLPEIVRLATKIGVSRLDVNGLEPYTEDILGNELWSSPMIHENLSLVLEEASRCAVENGLDLRLTGMIPGRASCPAAATPIILANGDVVPCAVLAYSRNSFFKVEENKSIVRENSATTSICFGNIHDRNIAEIWFSPKYVAFREQVLSGCFPQACRSCLVKHGIICVRDSLTAREIIAQISSQATSGDNR